MNTKHLCRNLFKSFRVIWSSLKLYKSEVQALPFAILLQRQPKHMISQIQFEIKTLIDQLQHLASECDWAMKLASSDLAVDHDYHLSVASEDLCQLVRNLIQSYLGQMSDDDRFSPIICWSSISGATQIIREENLEPPLSRPVQKPDAWSFSYVCMFKGEKIFEFKDSPWKDMSTTCPQEQLLIPSEAYEEVTVFIEEHKVDLYQSLGQIMANRGRKIGSCYEAKTMEASVSLGKPEVLDSQFKSTIDTSLSVNRFHLEKITDNQFLLLSDQVAVRMDSRAVNQLFDDMDIPVNTPHGHTQIKISTPEVSFWLTPDMVSTLKVECATLMNGNKANGNNEILGKIT